MALASRDSGITGGWRNRRDIASTQAIGGDGSARNPVATSDIGTPAGVGGRPRAVSTPSSRARDSLAPIVANQTLQETATASAGRSGCRSRGWLQRMICPLTVASPSHGTRVSADASPVANAATSVAILRNDPGSVGCRSRASCSPATTAPLGQSTTAQAPEVLGGGCAEIAWSPGAVVTAIATSRAETHTARCITRPRETSRRQPT